MNSKVTILGGSGFIGQHLIRKLLERDYSVTSFDRELPKKSSLSENEKDMVEWVIGDFQKNDDVENALIDADYVYHLISTTLPNSSNQDLSFDMTSNILPTLNLLDLSVKLNIKKVFFVSSGGTIYGDPLEIPIPETHPNNPICGYGIHKLMIEKYLYLYKSLYDLNYCIIRLANPYGEAQISERPQGVIGNFVYKVVHNQELEIWGDGKVIRDYIHINDVSDVLIKIIKYTGEHKIFNVGTGKGYSLLDIVNIIENISSSKINVSFRDSRTVDLSVNVLDISSATRELGWTPRYSIVDGISEMIHYAKK